MYTPVNPIIRRNKLFFLTHGWMDKLKDKSPKTNFSKPEDEI